jgi:hypothetical protein
MPLDVQQFHRHHQSLAWYHWTAASNWQTGIVCLPPSANGSIIRHRLVPLLPQLALQVLTVALENTLEHAFFERNVFNPNGSACYIFNNPIYK